MVHVQRKDSDKGKGESLLETRHMSKHILFQKKKTCYGLGSVFFSATIFPSDKAEIVFWLFFCLVGVFFLGFFFFLVCVCVCLCCMPSFSKPRSLTKLPKQRT